jgi:hypothetical protein
MFLDTVTAPLPRLGSGSAIDWLSTGTWKASSGILVWRTWSSKNCNKKQPQIKNLIFSKNFRRK